LFTMHSTLLIGNYDWDAARMPKEEFQARIREFWKRVPEAAGLAVYGDRRNNAELAYFGHLVPKLRDSVAFIPRAGEPRMLVAGGANAMPPAARQTWIEKNEALTELPKAVAQWQKELGGPVAVVGVDRVRLGIERGLADALGAGEASARAAAAVRALMRAKSARELAEIRGACGMLKAAATALRDGVKAGKGITDCMAQAEHEAVKLRAMEVRSLFSTDGGRTLRPYISPIARPADALLAYLAVRSGGYWAEGFIQAGEASNEAAAKARETLKKVIAAMQPGANGRDLARLARGGIAPLSEHGLTRGRLGHAIGLALEEPPLLSAESDAKLEAGDVYTVRVGASDGKAQHSIVSAMVALTGGGNEVLCALD
jgi:Xaa-Pro aminopeptidase